MRKKYIDLIDPERRIATLRRAAVFVNAIGSAPANTTITTERLECAFALAENPSAHRTVASNASHLFVTKEIAYGSAALVCAMWRELKPSLGELRSVYNYTVWKNTSCPA